MVDESKSEHALRVLIVEPDENQRQVLTKVLSPEGFDICFCSTADDARDRLRTECFFIVITEFRIDLADSLKLLDFVKRQCPGTLIIIYTAHGSVDSAKEAIHFGAFAFVERQSGVHELVRQLQRAIKEKCERKHTSTLELYEHLINDVDAIVWEADAQTWKITVVSQQAEKILGYPVEQWLSESDFWANHIHVDDRQSAIQLRRQRSDMEDEYSLEYRAIAADGRIVWLHDRVRVVRTEEGKPETLRGIMIDIDAKKRAEIALRENEQRFRQLAENICAVFWMRSGDGLQQLYVSPKYEEIWGRSLESLNENPESFLHSIHPEDRSRVMEAFERLRSGGQPSEYDIEYRIQRPDGEVRWIHDRGFSIVDEDGLLLRQAGFAADVTNTQKALEQSRIGSRAIDSAQAGIVIVDATQKDTPIIYCNPAFEKLTGYPKEEVLGKNCRLLQAGDRDQDGIRKLRRAVKAGQVCTSIVRNYRKDGTPFWNEVSIAPVQDSTGKLTHLIGFQNDISEQKRAEATLLAHVRQQSDVAEIGLAALQEVTTSELMDKAVKLVAKTLDVEYAKVLELCDSGEEFLLRSGVGWSEGLVGFACVGTEFDSQAGFTLQSAEPVIVRDLRTEKRFSGSALLESHGVVSGMSVVIQGHPTPYGVLGIHTKQKREFKNSEVYYLQAVANVLADAVRQSRAQAQLAASETKFRELVESSHDVITMFSPQGECLYVSPSVKRVLGYEPSELIGKVGPVIIHPDDVQQAMEQFAEYLNNPGAVGPIRHRIQHKDGSYRTIEGTGTNLLHEPSVNAMVSNFRDVTERERAEKERHQLVSLVEHSRDFISLANMDGRISYINRNGMELVGLDGLEEARSTTQVHYFPEEDVLRMDSEVMPALLAKLHWRGEYRFKHFKTGKHIPIEIDSFIINDGVQQEPIGIGVVARDITERKNAESRHRLTQFAVDRHNGGCMRVGPDGRFNYVNESACKSLGYSRSELMQMYVWDIDPNWSRKQWPAAWRRIKKDVSLTLESQYRRRDGRLVPVEVTANYFSFDDQEFVFAFATDLTKRKQEEERTRELVSELAHVHRLASMGEMASVLAHEVNQPLGTIANYAGTCANLLQNDRIDLAELRPILEKINEQTLRAGSIISGLKKFVSKAEPKQAKVGVNELCLDAKELLKAEADSKGVRVELDLASNLPDPLGDPIQLQQVVVNLVKNGIEATNRCGVKDGRVLIKTSREAENVYVCVEDEGAGIENERIEQVFEPYFTSKRDGLGMGLNICRTIIRAHAGTLDARNKPEGGAEFTFCIPLHKAPATAHATKAT